MSSSIDLAYLGARLKAVDTLMLMLARRRTDLALLVGKFKFENQLDIVRSEIELERINEARAWAIRHGLDPGFAAALRYLLINESCKQQLIQLERKILPSSLSEDEQYAQFKRNLLELTKLWAPEYDRRYDSGYFATRDYLRFETEILKRQVGLLQYPEAMLDLGCATGRVLLELIPAFKMGIGYDLSSEMIMRADFKSRQKGLDLKAFFKVCDIEERIPHKEDFASFVVMNLGTASDVRDLGGVISEVMRILRPGGRFLFSFYNTEALLYRWDLPWPPGLAASINPYKHCLEVQAEKRNFEVYARSYTLEEVRTLLKKNDASELELVTYPAISSLLPPEILEDQPELQESIAAIDRSLAPTNMGAYIIATGCKA